MKVTGGLRYRTCPDCGDLHDVNDWPDNHRRFDEVLCAPGVISDVMDAVRSQGNGRMYDSKSEMRKHYKHDGFIEVGNDPARLRPKKKKPIDKEGIAQSVEKAVARYNNGERIKGKARYADGPYRAPI